jgi:hypothetical protein
MLNVIKDVYTIIAVIIWVVNRFYTYHETSKIPRMTTNPLLLVFTSIIMKNSFDFQVIIILYVTFIILDIGYTNLIAMNAVGYSDSIRNNTSHLMENHNFTQMIQRGNIAMGFDQNKICHEFSSTMDGGHIKITSLDENDIQTINQIRNHTRDILNDFAEGNFTKPFFIHEQSVPGTDAMVQNKDQIQYKIQDLNNGSILFLITNNSGLANSINQFMTFQSTEHKGH